MSQATPVARPDHIRRPPRQRHGHGALVDATSGHPFIRHDVPPAMTAVWWEVDGAVAFRRQRRTGHVLAFLGADASVAELVDHLPAMAARTGTTGGERAVVGVTVPQHLEALLHERFRVSPGGDWEWFHTSTLPERARSHDRVVPLDDVARHEEILAFLAEHSPAADIAPGGREDWFAIERRDGRLAAVAASGWTPAGAPHLSSVAVDTALRGQGLGRDIVAALTRRAVVEHGVCTLAMYSHNTAARGLYLSLGYDNPCRWASRAVALSA